MHNQLLFLVLLLSATVLTVGVARRFRLPAMLAYLAVGAAMGGYGVEFLAKEQDIEFIAEFGIVFLMFSIGLEFSLTRLKAMRSLVFGFGASQLLLTAVGTGLVTWFGYQQDWRAGIAVGLAVTMSSTAIVAKMLSERFELHSRSGRQTMGVLLFQDLAVVPCLILLPALAQPEGDLARSLSIAMAVAVAVLSVLVWAGQRFMRRIFDAVAHIRSTELFVLAVLWVVLTLAYITASTGLSMALGAFVGGMLISETAYRHQVEADIRPFRDIFLGFFFITVGMMLDLGYVLSHFPLLLLAVFLLVAGKWLVVLAISLLARSSLDVALRTAAQLAQAGEFGLVLIGLARDQKLIADDVFQITLTAMLMSMFIAPFLISQASRMSSRLIRGDWSHKAKVVHDIATSSMELDQHVILCGFGRSGQRVGEFLAAEGIPYIAIDLDPRHISQGKAKGGKIVFGNADRPEVLKAAGIARARAVVVAYPDSHSAERAVRQVRLIRPDIPMVARASDDSVAKNLKLAGATEVIPEVLEGSLMLAAEALAQLDIPVERAMARVRAARSERYASLRDFYGDNPSVSGENLTLPASPTTTLSG